MPNEYQTVKYKLGVIPISRKKFYSILSKGKVHLQSHETQKGELILLPQTNKQLFPFQWGKLELFKIVFDCDSNKIIITILLCILY